MNCSQCGKEIPENSVFCPFCGVPQKVTADYDYIQGEIGANVNKIKTGSSDEAGIGPAASRHDTRQNNDLGKTRKVYGSDTIYEDRPHQTQPEPRRREPERHYREEYYDHYYDDGYDDEYEYEDWGIEPGGSNKRTVITTIIIAIICLAGIAAIIYFGLRPQAGMASSDVVRCLTSDNKEIQDGDSFSGSVEVVLVSRNGLPVRYTLDGSEVTNTSELYTKPITIEGNGSQKINAASFNQNGEPSGGTLTRTFTLEGGNDAEKADTEAVAETEAATDEAGETEPAISQEQAKQVVETALIEGGIMNENLEIQDGGFINLIHAGRTEIDGNNYYVVQADYYDSEGHVTEVAYYGVDTMESSLSYLIRDENGDFIIS